MTQLLPRFVVEQQKDVTVIQKLEQNTHSLTTAAYTCRKVTTNQCFKQLRQFIGFWITSWNRVVTASQLALRQLYADDYRRFSHLSLYAAGKF